MNIRKLVQQRTLITIVATALLPLGNSAVAGNFFKDAEKVIRKHIKREVTRPIRTIKKVAKDPVRGLLELPINDFLETCGAPIEDYGTTLESQAAGRWKTLPAQLIADIQAGYSNDLTNVRYAEDIDTSNGDAQTFGNSIYFPRSIDLRDADDMYWMLHELQHTDQYRGNTQAAKLCDYVLQAVSVGFDHDDIRWEREADAKADRMLSAAMQAINGGSLGNTQQLAAHQIIIQNDTDVSVVFRVESANTEWTAHTAEPHSAGVITGVPGDSWFNVAVMTDDVDISYGVDGGSTHAIRWNQDGLLDFFEL
jgi:hypothetical protein